MDDDGDTVNDDCDEDTMRTTKEDRWRWWGRADPRCEKEVAREEDGDTWGWVVAGEEDDGGGG